jgi:DnaD/phage-associated family protein
MQDPRLPVEPLPDLPNIFQLYEENIGPLTPMLADTLREAETAYPAAWIEEAMRIAVENNVRRWRYVEAILNSWKEEGRDEQDRRDTEKDRRRYIEGKFAKFIEHG